MVMLILVSACLCSSHVSAGEGASYGACGAVAADSVAASAERMPARINSGSTTFNYRQLFLPVGLITVGAVGVQSGIFNKLNNSIRDGIASVRNDHYFKADDYIQYLPIVAYVGLGTVGVPARHPFRERFVAGAAAYLSLGIMVNGIKLAVNEKRPHSNARNSFPSGHTATAFMGAELLRLEYGLGIAAGGYAVATMVGLMRIYNDRHWLNDVLAGAGIGILSARIGYWMLPVCRRWFRWDKAQAVVIPAFDYGRRTLGVAMAVSFRA